MKLSKKISLFFRRRRKVKQLEDKLKNNLPKQLLEINKSTIAFKSSNNPKVSIIIPFFNQEIYTRNCLQYLHKNLTDKYPYEIILIDDNSPESYDFSNISGITIIKNEINLGFLKNINIGINHSKGEYIYLLNNDTEVYENFLDELFYVFENFKDVGAVGSMLLNPDLSLQEAGAVFMKDYTIHQIFRDRMPFYPEVNYIRKVDYCSGCSLLFKKNKDNGALNLLDEQFAPAYFEDPDLCFDLKYNQNKKIYYTPFSKVLHYNGITYNDKTKLNQESESKKEVLMNTNKIKFYEKWKNQINAIQAETIDDRILEINNNKSVVFINHTVPEFDRDAGSNRLKELMNVFIKKDYNVTLVSKETFIWQSYIDTYQRMGINIFFEHKKFKGYKYYLSKFCKNADYVWIHGPYTFDKYFDTIKSLFANAKFIFDMVDIHHLRYKRAYEANKQDKSNLKNHYKFKKIELKATKKSDYVITVSDAEKEFMKTYCNKNKLITISTIHYPKVNPNLINSHTNRKDILFIGSTHHPNVDAIYFLYEKIMPIVWKTNPEMKINIIGNIDTIVTDIADERFIFHGFVEDVDPLFNSSKLMVAPLLIGAGVKGKIGQSFEYYLPVVTTTIGAEGMFLKNEENVLIADNEEDFASAILQLYENESLWTKLSKNSEKSLFPFSVEKASQVINTNF
jgi:O-antigen biosynthesis protein